MTVLRGEGADLEALRERVDSLTRLLLGEEAHSAPGEAAERLRRLAELAADAAVVERRSAELRSLMHALDDGTGAAQELLDRQAAAVRTAVQQPPSIFLQRLLDADVWETLRERLDAVGVLGPNASDPLVAGTLARERAKAEAEVRARYEERNSARLHAERLQRMRLEERLRGEGERKLLEARVKVFNESVPFRVRWLLIASAGLLGLCLIMRVLLDLVRWRLSTPQLVDETSIGPLSFLPRPPWLSARKSRPAPTALAEALERFFEARGADDPCIVLAPEARASVRTMAFAVGEAARRQLSLPNAVFYGPPGTGKTLTARRLARACGLDYALLSGGNVIGLRERAVPELRRVLHWASRVRSQGLVLFIDEADAFLAPRSGAHAAHDPFVQAAAAFFLAATGQASRQLLVVLATNRLEELDPAVISRMSYPIEFGPPG
eukprot:CAMPEP_0168367384 /NCGR_PEP_ID=MMETSP0228-20121227/5713_1 /TAXON_ID=133427 /ORGANISM="Protoceratium reticulatum, Strain CCCM 535 (=CCMP 1889)" /LENGTH=437 /DNA_ID=CAMNT_0008380209 /DNA_START=52 /DNA_END=1362 /DNA_ORIENTATION=+